LPARNPLHSANPCSKIGGANALKTGVFDRAFPEITLFLAISGTLSLSIRQKPGFFSGVVDWIGSNGVGGFNYPDSREKRLFDFGKSMLIANAASNPPTNAVAKKDRSIVPTLLDGKEVGISVISIPMINAMIATH